jgi:Icc-related predicted phosphoesterase
MNQDKARIWFFTDIHGSDECFRKFLATVRNENKPNVIIVGGDITGKQIIPLVEEENGGIKLKIGDGHLKVPSSELSGLKQRLADYGYYPYECNEQEYRQLVFDTDTYRSVIDRLASERLHEWVTLADRTLPSSDVCQAFINAGNDDSPFVDQILDKSTKLIRPEGKVFDLPAGLKLLSTGYSNPTPWKCPRDVKEESLEALIAHMTAKLTPKDLRKAIFNFHCPPRDTALDLAFKINPVTLQPHAGFKGAQREHVGSTAVRKAIEWWKPLIGLHGHIHEVNAKDRVGDTLCFNPGSDYRTGHLQGVFLQINKSGEVEADVLTHERDPLDSRDKPLSWLDALLSVIPFVGHGLEAHQAAAQRADMQESIKQVQQKIDALYKMMEGATSSLPSQPTQLSPEGKNPK